MSKVVVHPQVETFVRALAPEPRRRPVVYEMFEQILAEQALE